LILSHPVYNYPAKRYKMNIGGERRQPHGMPGDKQWLKLQKTLRKRPAKWMTRQGNPMQHVVYLRKAF
jgi:zinc transport system substrate-binding protein